ncbi:hypothetical protein RchiOBHm_Chr4g0436551 [Rosa chinensis]|uniref:Uncharacterized protein n=1 Tax=Rosa chinensis TaxID=74649 RepID=A0A2P6R235_ROSCH|nr:hypothetical protein RchiOBHm_Chr4g0436551 [Rosa chinensis]
MEIMYSQRWRERSDFTAKSISCFRWHSSTRFLREKGWRVYRRTPYNYELGEAQGLDSSLQSHLPGFDFPLSSNQNDCSEALVVGKWYCPFIFVKEGGVTLKEQMNKLGWCGRRKSVGLSMKIVERMKWEQERVGWVGGDERQVRVERVEEFGGSGEWKKFACYVLGRAVEVCVGECMRD